MMKHKHLISFIKKLKIDLEHELLLFKLTIIGYLILYSLNYLKIK